MSDGQNEDKSPDSSTEDNVAEKISKLKIKKSNLTTNSIGEGRNHQLVTKSFVGR